MYNRGKYITQKQAKQLCDGDCDEDDETVVVKLTQACTGKTQPRTWSPSKLSDVLEIINSTQSEEAMLQQRGASSDADENENADNENEQIFVPIGKCHYLRTTELIFKGLIRRITDRCQVGFIIGRIKGVQKIIPYERKM